MTLGDKIKHIRRKRKISQSELAEAANVYQKDISRYESDQTVPSALVLKKISEALSVSADYLLSTTSENRTIQDKKLESRFIALQEMTGKNKDVAIHLLDLLIRDYKTKQNYTDEE